MKKFKSRKVLITLAMIVFVVLIVLTSLLYLYLTSNNSAELLKAQSSALSSMKKQSTNTKNSDQKNPGPVPNSLKLLPYSINKNITAQNLSYIYKVITIPAPSTKSNENNQNYLTFVLADNKDKTEELLYSLDNGKTFIPIGKDNTHGLIIPFLKVSDFFTDVNHNVYVILEEDNETRYSSISSIYCLSYNSIKKDNPSNFKFKQICPPGMINAPELLTVNVYFQKNSIGQAKSNIYFYVSFRSDEISYEFWMYNIDKNSVNIIKFPDDNLGGSLLIGTWNLKIFRDSHTETIFFTAALVGSDSLSYLLLYAQINLSVSYVPNSFTESKIGGGDEAPIPPLNNYNIHFSYSNKTLFIGLLENGRMGYGNKWVLWSATLNYGTLNYSNIKWASSGQIKSIYRSNNIIYLGSDKGIYYVNPNKVNNNYRTHELTKIDTKTECGEFYAFFSTTNEKNIHNLYVESIDNSNYRYYLYPIIDFKISNSVFGASIGASNDFISELYSTNIATYIIQNEGDVWVSYDPISLMNKNSFSLFSEKNNSKSTPKINVLSDNESVYVLINQTIYTQFSPEMAFRFSDNTMTSFIGQDHKIYYSFNNNSPKSIDPDTTYFNTKKGAKFNNNSYSSGKLDLSNKGTQNIDKLLIATNSEGSNNYTYNFLTETSALNSIKIVNNGFDHYFDDPDLVTNVNGAAYPIISAWNDKQSYNTNNSLSISFGTFFDSSASYYQEAGYKNGVITTYGQKQSITDSLSPGIYEFHVSDRSQNTSSFIIEVGYSNQQIPFKINDPKWNALQNALPASHISTNTVNDSENLYLPFDTNILHNFLTFLNDYSSTSSTPNLHSKLQSSIKTKYNFSSSYDSLNSLWNNDPKNPQKNFLNISNVSKLAKEGSLNINNFFNTELWTNYKSQLVSIYYDSVQSDINSVQQDAKLMHIASPTIGKQITSSQDLKQYKSFVESYKKAVQQKTQQWLSSSDCKNYNNTITLGWGVNFTPDPKLSSGDVALSELNWASGMTVSSAIEKYYSLDKLQKEYKTETIYYFEASHQSLTPEAYQVSQNKAAEQAIDTHGNSLIDILNYAKIGTSKLPKPENKSQFLNYYNHKSYQVYLQIESDAYNDSLPGHSSNTSTPTWIYEILIPIAGAVFIVVFISFLVLVLRRNSRKIAEKARYQKDYARMYNTGMKNGRSNQHRTKPQKSALQKKLIESKVSKTITVTPISKTDGGGKWTHSNSNSKHQSSPSAKSSTIPNTKNSVVSLNRKTSGNINKKQLRKTVSKGSSASGKVLKHRQENAKKTFTKVNGNLTKNQGQNIHNLLARRASEQKNKK